MSQRLWVSPLLIGVLGMLMDAIITTATAAEPCLAGQAIARLVSVQGAVELNRVAAAPEALVCAGDVVYVAARSRAAILLLNTETILRLDQESELRLQPPPQPRRSVLELLKGAAYLFSREPRSLDVRTPYVNAAVEGTEFLVRVEPDRTFISVFEGRVLAANPQGQLSLGSHQSVSAPANQPPQLVTVVRPRDAVQWTLYYQPVLAALLDPAAKPPQRLQGIGSSWDDRAIPRLFEQLEQTPPAEQDQNFYVFRAGLWLTVGQVGPARRDLDQALKLTPDYSPALALLAMIAVTQNDPDSALKLANQAVQQDPNSAAARIALSYVQQAQFDLNGALASLQQAVQLNPRNALAQARLAELWLSLGYLDKALAAAQQAVMLNPNLARTQTVLGFAYLIQIRIREAQRAFTRAIELDQADPLPRLGLGLAKIRRGKLQDGRSDIEIAVSLNPDNSLLRSYMGKAYYEEKRNPLAASQYDLAKQLDPLDPTPWLYDGIRKQTENQPVFALRDIEQSIALNDNRAVFRSRLALDQDLAVRQTSLARIYNDLGFEQLALTEATKSLTLDPTNFSAHRFLSDTYANLPRHEIARVSELLQAQLLQPLNINPVQPSLFAARQNIITGTGLTAAAFYEFTPLFERDRPQLLLSGVAGNNHTWADEVILSGIKGPLSYSFGQYRYETNGFRENNDLDHDIYDLFGQVAVTPNLNVQAEYRWQEANYGDLRLNFDPEDFSPLDRYELRQDALRLGMRYSPSPRSDILVSLIRSNRDDDQNLVRPFPVGDFIRDALWEDEGYQGETQYLYRRDRFNLIAGLGAYRIDSDRAENFTLGEIPLGSENRTEALDQETAYIYTNLRFPQPLHWTLGLSYDAYNDESTDLAKYNPKLGLQWDIAASIQLRLAAYKTLKRALTVDQTIEPTQIAGFNQFYDDFNGTQVKNYGIGADIRFAQNWYGGIEALHRDLEVINIVNSLPVTSDRQESLYLGYLYWTPHPEWSLTAQYLLEQFERQEDERAIIPVQVDTQSVPLAIRYFNPHGPFAELGANLIHQTVDLAPDSSFVNDSDNFALINATIGYRFPKRQGMISLQANNLLDKEFLYQDAYFQSSYQNRRPLLTPDRTIMLRLAFNF